MSIRVEKSYPLAIAIICGLVYMFYSISHSELAYAKNMKDFFSMIVSAGSIAVGFLTGIRSVLLSINEKQAIKQLKEGGYYLKLLEYLSSAATGCFIMVIFSLILVACANAGIILPPLAHLLVASAWIAVATFSAAACHRLLSIFSLIMRNAASQQ